jgi:hypothetical protein
MRGQLRQISLRLSRTRLGTRQISSTAVTGALHLSSSPGATAFGVQPNAPSRIDCRFASFRTAVTPVELSYDVTEPKEFTAPGQSLVICHGLL